eukprot:scaffold409_cov167-Ochromonas_danica.AAC.1
MLTEVHLTESRIYHALQNIPKGGSFLLATVTVSMFSYCAPLSVCLILLSAKASLTASRTAANSIYVVPLLQAEIDEMSGILLCEEGEYNTAYSYFLEAFDAYDTANQSRNAVSCLKYMVLCKILNKSAQEVSSLLASKIGAKHAGKDLEAMAAVAKAAKDFSLEEFKAVMKDFDNYLSTDDLISHHLDLLYDNMLEANLLKIIHPFSVIELSHIAKLIKLTEEQVVRKLSQMILDHKFHGILDQGRGHLIIYDASQDDASFTRGAEVIANLGEVVQALASRTITLSKPLL